MLYLPAFLLHHEVSELQWCLTWQTCRVDDEPLASVPMFRGGCRVGQHPVYRLSPPCEVFISAIMDGGRREVCSSARGCVFSRCRGGFSSIEGAGDGVQKPAVGWLGWCMHPASSSNSSSQTFANISSWMRIRGARLEAFIVCRWKQTICHDTAARNAGMGMIFITREVAKHLSQSESVYGSVEGLMKGACFVLFKCGPLFVEIAFGTSG